MLKARPLAVVLAFLLTIAAFAQAPADVLVAKIRSETAVKFTHKVAHQKTSGIYTVVVLHVKPKDQVTDNAKVLGLLKKKAGKWAVTDYVLGTSTQTWIKLMQKGHPEFPKALYPKKI